ncbi:MAG: ComEC/Rec2 family competence protein [Clostridiaceae bacterium]|nr:ComEC/Rec2 family competence protein [Clostridiaceae bacterium]
MKLAYRKLFPLSTYTKKFIKTGDTLPGMWLACAVIVVMFVLLPLSMTVKTVVTGTAILAFIVVSILHHTRGTSALLVLLAFGIALAALAAHTFDMVNYKSVLYCSGSNMDTEATILDYGTCYDDRVRVQIRVNRLNGQEIRPFLSYIYLSGEETPEAGMILTGRFHYSIPEDTSDFARESYYRAHMIYVLAETRGEYTLSPASSELSYCYIRYILPAKCAHWFGEKLRVIYEEGEAGILLSLILGDKTRLPEGYEDDMRDVGLSHIMAVSGMNVSLISGFFLLIFARRRTGAAAAIPAIVLFAFITGAGASVVRAVIMQGILLVSYILGERSESLNNLLIAVAIMLLMNPYAVQDAGLWLSFFSTMGLTLYGARFRAAMMKPFCVLPWFVRRMISVPITMIATTLTAQVFVLPLLVFLFGSFSLIAPLANLLVVWAAEISFLGGILTALLSTVLPGAAMILAKPVSILVEFQRWVVPRMADWPISTLWTENEYVVIGLAICYLHLLLFYLCRTRMLLRYILSVCSITLCVVAFFGLWESERTTTVTTLNTHGGQCTVFIRGDDCAVINCGGLGSGEKLIKFLESQHIRNIDLLLLTDYKSTSKSGLPELIDSVPIDTVLLPYSEMDSVPVNAAKSYVVAEDLYLTIGGAMFRVLVSDAVGFDAYRLAVYFTVGGYSYFIPGSVDANELTGMLLRHDIPGANVVIAGDYYTNHLPPFSADWYLLSSYADIDINIVHALCEHGMTAVDLSEAGNVTFTMRDG